MATCSIFANVKQNFLFAKEYCLTFAKMVESTGSGYLPPHQASVASMSAEVRHAAGIDSGMIPLQG